MKLQVAFDVKSYSHLQKIMKDIHRHIDILEVGTLLLKSEGVETIKKAKKDFGLPVFADLKCMDAGKFEVQIAADAGADYITILGASYENNIKEFIDECKKSKVKSVVDSINCPNDKILRTQDMGIDVIELHTGYMNKVGSRPWDDIEQIYNKAKVPIFMSGGMGSANLKDMERFKPKIDTVVVGRAIVYSDNPKEEAKKIRSILDTF